MPISGSGRLLPSCGENQRGDPRGIGLKRQRDHVEHHFHPLFERVGNAFGSYDSHRFGSFASCSNLTIRSSISRKLVRYSSSLWPSCGAELAAQRAGIVANEVEDRPVRLLPERQILAAALQPCRRRTTARTRAADSPRPASASSPSATKHCTGRRTRSRCRSCPRSARVSHVNSSDGKRVRWPTCWAAT